MKSSFFQNSCEKKYKLILDEVLNYVTKCFPVKITVCCGVLAQITLRLPLTCIFWEKKTRLKMSALKKPKTRNLYSLGPLKGLHLVFIGLQIRSSLGLQLTIFQWIQKLDTLLAPCSLLMFNPLKEELLGMNEWCVKQHGLTGLTQACRDSKVTLGLSMFPILAISFVLLGLFSFFLKP